MRISAQKSLRMPDSVQSVVPFTLIVIKPTNAQLLTHGRDLASAETRALLEKWGRLHAVRSV
ncbi:DUF1772 domain-containing protein [Pararobbsia alpina]|uniref:DUF1772 domain-containing protein n=1 Tax=Pararobbsia alpina TaxID=621374 RepID=UPI001581721B